MQNEVYDVAVRESTPLTAVQIRAQVNLIQEVMQAVMKKDVHYGVIPGTPKPTLYKAGAEKILSTFRIGVEPETEDLSNYETAHYRVKAKGFDQKTGALLGVGVGDQIFAERADRLDLDAEVGGRPDSAHGHRVHHARFAQHMDQPPTRRRRAR